jgi:hypothetical protein
MKRNLLETILRTVFLLLVAAFLYYLFYKPVEGFFVKEDACSVARADKTTIDTEISKFLTGDRSAHFSGAGTSSSLVTQCIADPNNYWCKDIWVGYNNMIPSTLSAAIGTRSEIQDTLSRNNCTASSTQFLCQTLNTQVSLLNDAITSSQSDINEYTQYISEKRTNSTNLDTLIQNAC